MKPVAYEGNLVLYLYFSGFLTNKSTPKLWQKFQITQLQLQTKKKNLTCHVDVIKKEKKLGVQHEDFPGGHPS